MSKQYVLQELDDVNSQLASMSTQKATYGYVDAKTQANNLSYKESYDTLVLLQAAYPSGDVYNHTVKADDMIYTWVNSAWTSTNVQANGTGVASNTIDATKITASVKDVIYEQYSSIAFELGAINVSGTEVVSTTRIRSYFIYAKSGSVIKSNDANYVFSIARYTTPIVTTFIEYLTYTSSYTVTSDCYIRLTLKKTDDSTVDTSISSYFTFGILGIGAQKGISNLKNTVSSLLKYSNITLTDGKYVNYSTGATATLDGMSASGLIRIPNRAKIYLEKCSVVYTANYAGLAFFDEYSKYISGYQYDGSGADVSIVAPDNAYYITFSVSTRLKSNFNFYVSVAESVVSLENSLFKRLHCLFENVICIGDSLTRGYYAEYESGQRNRDFSYPFAIARMTNLQVENYGISGATASSWYANYQSRDFSSFDCAIICLGRNEGVTGDNATAYQNIINKLKTDNPHITIFICSIPPSDVASALDDPINVAIKSIATSNSLPYLDIYNDPQLQDSKYRSDGIHFYTLGYLKLGERILYAINRYIELHESDFMQLWISNDLPQFLH
jgi:lysophospholipase L1-like esterase